MLNDLLKKVSDLVKNILFPRYCLECGREGEWICAECFRILQSVIKPQFFCPRCYKNNFSGRVCHGCLSKSFLDRSFAVAQYEEKLVSKLIQMLKYDYIEEAGDILGRLIGNFVRKNSSSFSLLIQDFLIVPVPLHRRRYVWRGFNQAEILASFWSRAWGIETDKKLLVRSRCTKTQMGLTGAERRKNLIDAFAVKKPLPKSKIILVDDVFTTGSTLQECARALKLAGASEVWGVTAAREG